MEAQSHWFVVYTRPRWEKKVAALLTEKGIENYCPLNKIVRQWSDRKKVVLEPLFKGYVFVKVVDAQKWDVKKVEGIINYVHWLGRPAIVKEEEIVTIQKFLQEFKEVQVENMPIIKNAQVIVKQGLLMSYKGIVVDVTGNKARVKINSMNVSLTATFEADNLSPLLTEN